MPATYYVGAGGVDTNAGTSWATRLLTLNAAEDAHGGGTPKPAIAAGDTVYVGPGVYRELLTCDVSGLVGQPITYVADVTGEHTDGIGGVVRISGSNNDQTATRANGITASAKNYRTFRGFMFDGNTTNCINTTNGCTNWTVEDCSFYDCLTTGVYVAGAGQAAWTIRRCLFIGRGEAAGLIYFFHTVTVDNCGHLVQNCQFFSGRGDGVYIERVGGISIRNCYVTAITGFRIVFALSAGQTVTVNNCILYGCTTGVRATVVGELIENFNCFCANNTVRTNVAVGANSNYWTPVFQPPILNSGVAQISGFQLPWTFGSLSSWSQIRAIAGASEATEDLFGIARPATAALNSWGPVQFQQVTQEATTFRTGPLSQEFTTAGRRHLIIPVQAVNTTVTVYCYREAQYAGTAPQMVLKQSGQADITVTDAGAAGVWNQLTHTWIPAAVPTWIVIELVSNNTAAAGAFACYFDDLTVSPLDTDTQEAWLTNEQPVNYAEEASVASAAFSPVGSDIVKG